MNSTTVSKKCKRCTYFDKLDDTSGLCDKYLEIKDKNFVCRFFKER